MIEIGDLQTLIQSVSPARKPSVTSQMGSYEIILEGFWKIATEFGVGWFGNLWHRRTWFWTVFQPQSQKWTPRIELPIPKPDVTNQILSIDIIFNGFWIMSPELDAGCCANLWHPCDGFSKIWLGFCILRWIRELTHCRVSPLFQHDQNPSSLSKLHRSKQLWVSTIILGGVFVQFDAKCATPYKWSLFGTSIRLW